MRTTTPTWLAAAQAVNASENAPSPVAAVEAVSALDGCDADDFSRFEAEFEPNLVDPYDDEPTRFAIAAVAPSIDTEIETVDGEIIPDGIANEHMDWFDSRGIPMDWARDEVNCRSIRGRRAEWPAGLQGFAESGGAIRFTYASLTGGPGWDQCRPDNPQHDDEGRTRKYVGNSGATTGERLIITKSMRDRFDLREYKKVIVTEGTGQTLVVSWLYRDQDDVLVIGVPGCWGWSAQGIAAPELHAAVAKADEVWVVFDKDVLTNPYVYDAGARVSGVVEAATGTRPRFPNLPTSGTTGVDDWVAGTFRRGDGTIDDVEARRSLNNLMASKTASKPLSAKRPAGKRLMSKNGQVQTATISRDDCSVSMHNPYDGGNITLAGFAPYIERSYVAASRLDKKARKIGVHDIAIMTPIGLLRVEEWPNDRLNRLDDLLVQAGYPLGVWINSDGAAAQIVAAMKADAERRGVTITSMSTETGWTTTASGQALYVEAVGGITADGYTRDDAKALLEDPNGQRFDLSDLEAADDDTQRIALRKTVLAGDLFVDPTWWMVSAGNLMWAGSGHVPEGLTLTLGKSNWGKSARQKVLASMMGPAYKMEGLIGKNYKVGSDIAQGLHNALAVPDDFAEDANNPAVYAEQVAILDMLARRAGGGDDESNGRQVKREGASGKWVNGEPDPSDVSFACSGETFPGTELRFSSRMRFLTVALGPNGWTKDDGVDNFDAWMALGKSGALRVGHGAYLRWVAVQIDRIGGFKSWVESLGKRRSVLAKELLTSAPEIPRDLNRVGLVAAGRLIGWQLLVEAALDAGAITAEKAAALKVTGHDMVLTAMVKHHRDHLMGDIGRLDKDALLTLIREAIAGGDWDVTGLGVKGNYGSARTIGSEHERDGQKYVCLIAAAVSDAVGVKRTKLLPALREACETGKPQDLWWDGKSVSCYWVKRENLFPENPGKG